MGPGGRRDLYEGAQIATYYLLQGQSPADVAQRLATHRNVENFSAADRAEMLRIAQRQYLYTMRARQRPQETLSRITGGATQPTELVGLRVNVDIALPSGETYWRTLVINVPGNWTPDQIRAHIEELVNGGELTTVNRVHYPGRFVQADLDRVFAGTAQQINLRV